MSLLIDHIGELVTCDPSHDGTPLGILRDAAVVVDGDRIAWVGPSARAPAADVHLAADGRAVVPGFVDSHSRAAIAPTSSPPAPRASRTRPVGSCRPWRPPGRPSEATCGPVPDTW